LIAWFQTRLVYKTGKWILYSVPVCISVIFFIAKFTAVDQSLVNNRYYYEIYETDFEYIDQQVQRAEELYQVKYSEKTLRTLEKWNTESSYNLVSDLKRSFENNRAISMDSIILAKITVHTLKLDGKPDFNYQKNEFYWDYPLPSSILRKIEKTDSSSPKVIELVKLFGEEIKLINTHVITFGDSLEQYDRKDFQRSAFLRNHLTENIYNEADSIRKIILMDSNLSVPDSLLPALNQKFRRPTFDDY